VSDLFSMLRSTANSLNAQRFGLDVVGQNIANVNTPGYVRRVALLGAVPPVGRWSAGEGAEILGVRAIRDRLLDRRVRDESSAQQAASAQADALAVLESLLGPFGGTIDRDLADFFDAFSALAESPTSTSARLGVTSEGQALAASFRDLAGRFADAGRDLDIRVRTVVDRVNTLAQRLAELNATLAGMAPTSAEALHVQDEANLVLEELSSLVDVRAIEREGGGFDVAFGSGRLLVVGDQASGMGLADRAGTGFADISAGGTIVTGEVRGGVLGGLLSVRDTNVPAYQAQLDELAYALVQQVNAQHRAGYDLDGTAGQDFFVSLGSVSGAAGAMALNPALAANGGDRLIAAAGAPGAAGDNTNARALAALRDVRAVDGTQTFEEAWAGLVTAVGRDAEAATQAAALRAEIVQQVLNLRDSVSGVSLDEEAADMLRFQRAYEANARFFQTVDETLATLMELVGA
jgi:flagellar hook-associated protein 1 FlgK